MPGDGVKIEVGEVQPFRAAVGDAFPRQVAVQVHLPEANGVRRGVARLDGRHAADVAHVGHRRQPANGGFYRAAKVGGIHGVGDIQRPEVAGDVFADLRVVQILVIAGGAVDLQNLRAQVAHVDAPGNRVCAVHRVLVHNVRIAGLKLNFGKRLKEIAGVDGFFADAIVGQQLVVQLAYRHVAKGFAVNPLYVIRREERHVGILFSQLKGDIRDHHAQRQGFDADFFIGVFALGIEETQNVGVVRVQINRTRALTRAKLVGVGEGIFQHLHDRDHAGGLVFDALNRRTRFTQVREQKRHAAAAFGELQRRVHRAAYRLHIIFNAQQEAGDQLAALGFAAVEKGRRGRLEAAGEDLVGELLRQRFIALRQGQRDHHHAIFKAF